MIRVVKFSGGLGNQLFEYCFYLFLKNKYPRDRVYWDSDAYLSYTLHYGFEMPAIFPATGCEAYPFIKKIIASEKLRKHLVKRIYEKQASTFDPDIRSSSRLIKYYEGYWQTEKYFLPLAEQVREKLTFREDRIKSENKAIAAEMKKENSISLHLRLGDYQNNPEARKVHGDICTQTYYRNAIEKMRQLFPEGFHLYLFSDEPERLSEIIPTEGLKITTITNNRGTDSWQDMYLMSSCSHHIIANSSFSWWGAWLNPNPDKVVITPSKWFNTMPAPDMVPENWIRLGV